MEQHIEHADTLEDIEAFWNTVGWLNGNLSDPDVEFDRESVPADWTEEHRLAAEKGYRAGRAEATGARIAKYNELGGSY